MPSTRMYCDRKAEVTVEGRGENCSVWYTMQWNPLSPDDREVGRTKDT